MTKSIARLSIAGLVIALLTVAATLRAYPTRRTLVGATTQSSNAGWSADRNSPGPSPAENSQTGLDFYDIGYARFTSTGVPQVVYTFPTNSNSNAIVTVDCLCRATTGGGGISVNDTIAKTLVGTYKNTGGTVTVNSPSPTTITADTSMANSLASLQIAPSGSNVIVVTQESGSAVSEDCSFRFNAIVN